MAGAWSPRSVRANVGRLDNPYKGRQIGAHHGTQILRRAARHIDALQAQFVARSSQGICVLTTAAPATA